jgi:hypothetical protein
MNQYYYMKRDDNTQSYVMQYGPTFLPENFGITSGFNNLETNDPNLLLDLSWTGYPDYAFWKFIDQVKPSCSVHQKIKSQISLDQTNKVVNIQYSVVDLDATDIETLNSIFIESATPTRDQYLKLTDFTQIPDAPLSAEAKNDYLIFRQQLRNMFDVPDLSTVVWPQIPTSAPNVVLPPFPALPKYNPDQNI